MVIKLRCECGATYNIDAAKYGGRKIRCKACGAAVSVPSQPESEGEFEVIEDAATVRDGNATVPGGSAACAIADIAVPRRDDATREGIRRAFLVLHGDASERESPVLDAERKASCLEQELHCLSKQLERFTATLTKARATRSIGADLLSGKGLGILRQMYGMSSKAQTGEDVYEEAIQVNGAPVPPEKSLLSQLKKDREAKMATVDAACGKLRGKIAHIQSQMSNTRESPRSEWLSACRASLDQAGSLLDSGRNQEAEQFLSRLLKTAPIEMLEHVLTPLSRCAFLAGKFEQAVRHMQDAACFGAPTPIGIDRAYGELWSKAVAALPPQDSPPRSQPGVASCVTLHSPVTEEARSTPPGSEATRSGTTVPPRVASTEPVDTHVQQKVCNSTEDSCAPISPAISTDVMPPTLNIPASYPGAEDVLDVVKVLFSKIRIHIANGQHADAVALLDKVTQAASEIRDSQPDNDQIELVLAHAHAYRGEVFLGTGDARRAVAELKKAYACWTVRPGRCKMLLLDSTLNLGQAELQARNFAKAIDWFNAARDYDEGCTAYFMLGMAELEKGDYVSAEITFRDVIGDDPAHIGAHLGRARARLHQDEPDEALSDMGEALHLDPSCIEAYSLRYLALVGLGRKAEAMDDVTSILQLDPNRADMWENRGRLHVDAGRFDEALADLSEALRLDAALATAAISRGSVLFDRGQYDAAISDFTLAIDQRAGNAHAFYYRGLSHLKLVEGSPAEEPQRQTALADLIEANRLDPQLEVPFCGTPEEKSQRTKQMAWGALKVGGKLLGGLAMGALSLAAKDVTRQCPYCGAEWNTIWARQQAQNGGEARCSNCNRILPTS